MSTTLLKAVASWPLSVDVAFSPPSSLSPGDNSGKKPHEACIRRAGYIGHGYDCAHSGAGKELGTPGDS